MWCQREVDLGNGRNRNFGPDFSENLIVDSLHCHIAGFENNRTCALNRLVPRCLLHKPPVQSGSFSLAIGQIPPHLAALTANHHPRCSLGQFAVLNMSELRLSILFWYLEDVTAVEPLSAYSKC